MISSDICTKAASLVSGDRRAAYGEPIENFTRIAIMWNAWLCMSGASPARPITAHDVAQMMVGLKQARSVAGPYSEDTYTDEVGYAALAGEVYEASR